VKHTPKIIKCSLIERAAALDKTVSDFARDAALRAAAGYIGARVLLVHALTDHAKRFYEHFGFRTSPIDERMLMLLR
jgi:uncharacterized protein (DUF1778 family)